MKYGVNRQILLITAGHRLDYSRCQYSANRNCNLVKHLPRLDVQNRRSYRRFLVILRSGVQKALL